MESNKGFFRGSFGQKNGKRGKGEYVAIQTRYLWGDVFQQLREHPNLSISRILLSNQGLYFTRNYPSIPDKFCWWPFLAWWKSDPFKGHFAWITCQAEPTVYPEKPIKINAENHLKTIPDEIRNIIWSKESSSIHLHFWPWKCLIF